MAWSEGIAGNGSSVRWFQVWEGLFAGNGMDWSDLRSRIVEEVERCQTAAMSSSIEEHIHDYGSVGGHTLEMLSRDNLANVRNVQNHYLNGLRMKNMTDEEILRKKWQLVGKVINVGFVYQSWVPMQPVEMQFYVNLLHSIKPLPYIQNQVDNFFKKLYEKVSCLQCEMGLQQYNYHSMITWQSCTSNSLEKKKEDTPDANAFLKFSTRILIPPNLTMPGLTCSSRKLNFPKRQPSS